MTHIDGAIAALEQERTAIEKTLAETTARLEQVNQAITTMRSIAAPVNGNGVTPLRPPLALQRVEQTKRVGFTKGIRAQVMRALAGGSASSAEIAAVTRIDERDVRHALSTMESELLCDRLPDGKYRLTANGNTRATWLLQNPKARQFGGNHKWSESRKNGAISA